MWFRGEGELNRALLERTRLKCLPFLAMWHQLSAEPRPSRMLFYTDLPLALFSFCSSFTAYAKYLEDNGCNDDATRHSYVPHSDTNDAAAAYVPSGFPCESSTLTQTTWLLSHPTQAFLLSPDRRCWATSITCCIVTAWVVLILALGPFSPASGTGRGGRGAGADVL